MASRGVQTHYDKHATSISQRQRANGPLYELKKFHNAQKRDLIMRYARGVPTLLDLGCGRGGDIAKWNDAGIGFVRGLDISAAELDEATRRYNALSNRTTWCAFEAAALGDVAWHSAMPHDAVSAMFCAHYFFETQATLRTFLQTVSINLKKDGYFFGCVPDGARVREATSDDYLKITPMEGWSSDDPFGRAYAFALEDTVTADDKGTEGSVEYLVDMDVFVEYAAQYGLTMVEIARFEPPRDYPGHAASRLFASFVFQKTS